MRLTPQIDSAIGVLMYFATGRSRKTPQALAGLIVTANIPCGRAAMIDQ